MKYTERSAVAVRQEINGYSKIKYGEVIMEFCLNLCDIFTALIREYECIENLISVAENKRKIKYRRICLGSYFCDTYFIKNIKNMLVSTYPYCQENDIKITLTLPVFSESRLNDGLDLIDELLIQYKDVIDEVTVNDIGMLQYISKKNNLATNQGRMMQKYTRDIRYANYSDDRFQYCGYMDKYESFVEAVEFDICSKSMEIHIGRKKTIIHRNYQYTTMGRICWFAGLNRCVRNKFNLNSLCDESCGRFFLNYIDREGRMFYQVGKAVFSEVFSSEIKTDSEIRFADFPLYLWIDKYSSLKINAEERTW